MGAGEIDRIVELAGRPRQAEARLCKLARVALATVTACWNVWGRRRAILGGFVAVHGVPLAADAAAAAAARQGHVPLQSPLRCDESLLIACKPGAC